MARPDPAEKVREDRLRRMARRQGYVLSKSRSRDPMARDYELWMILDADTGHRAYGGEGNRHDLSLDSVEKWLLS